MGCPGCYLDPSQDREKNPRNCHTTIAFGIDPSVGAIQCADCLAKAPVCVVGGLSLDARRAPAPVLVEGARGQKIRHIECGSHHMVGLTESGGQASGAGSRVFATLPATMR